jgi:hypothetical protein
MKNFIPVLFLLICFGCSQSHHNSLPTDEVPFSEYVNSLDKVSLPFTCACAPDYFANKTPKYDSAGFAKYKSVDANHPYGAVIFGPDNIVTINLVAADYCVAPILISFDKNGKKLDSLDAYGNSYIDTASSVMPTFKIKADKSIVLIDTTKTWDLDSNSNVVPGSLVKQIDSTVYYLSKSGKFVKKKQP